MSDRCDLTERLVDQCACPHHRGGSLTDVTGPIDAAEPDSRAIPAAYPGTCPVCSGPIDVGQTIAHVSAPAGPVWVHAGELGCDQ